MSPTGADAPSALGSDALASSVLRAHLSLHFFSSLRSLLISLSLVLASARSSRTWDSSIDFSVPSCSCLGFAEVVFRCLVGVGVQEEVGLEPNFLELEGPRGTDLSLETVAESSRGAGMPVRLVVGTVPKDKR